jgi:hypothetical protein
MNRVIRTTKIKIKTKLQPCEKQTKQCAKLFGTLIKGCPLRTVQNFEDLVLDCAQLLKEFSKMRINV